MKFTKMWSIIYIIIYHLSNCCNVWRRRICWNAFQLCNRLVAISDRWTYFSTVSVLSTANSGNAINCSYSQVIVGGCDLTVQVANFGSLYLCI